MAQNDFDSLAMPTQSEDLMLDTHHDLKPSCSDRKTAYADGDEDYVPVNFIPEEVFAMIKAWELKQRDLMEVSDSMSVSRAASSETLRLEDYEPLRVCTQAAPPKRFYRTFWRSAARRVLDADKAGVLAAKRVSTRGTEGEGGIHGQSD